MKRLSHIRQKEHEARVSYGFPSQQSEDAQPLLWQVAIGLHAVPVGELKGQQVAAVLRAHCLGQQQRQTVVPWRNTTSRVRGQ